MNMVGFTSNVQNNTGVSSAPAFKGALGEKVVGEMIKTENYDPKIVMDAVKGTFGPKSDKVADIVETLVQKVGALTYEKKNSQKTISEQAEQITRISKEKDRTLNENDNLRKIVVNKNEEIAAKDKELTAAKEYAAKYEPMAKVKSIEEIGIVMPEDAIKTLSDMVEHRTEAHNSMFDFLMTGKGQEKALEQMDRNTRLLKAKRDGIFNIDEVSKKEDEANLHNVYIQTPADQVITMTRDALLGDPKGAYIAAPKIRTQVKDNAMALITPLYNDAKGEAGKEQFKARAAAKLDEELDFAVDYHKNFPKGMERIKKEYPGKEIEHNITPYDIEKSEVIVKNANGQNNDASYTYYNVYNIGKRR